MSFNVLKTDFFLHELLEAYFECKILSPLRKRGKRLPSAGRSGGDKSGKGLRHFSMKVCEKVQQKRTTSYNEVITLTRLLNSEQMFVKMVCNMLYDITLFP